MEPPPGGFPHLRGFARQPVQDESEDGAEAYTAQDQSKRAVAEIQLVQLQVSEAIARHRRGAAIQARKHRQLVAWLEDLPPDPVKHSASV